MTDTQFDSRRRLCPDGACIGVIGPDGRCSVCGRSASGKPDVALVGDPVARDDKDDDKDDTVEAPSEATVSDPAAAAPRAGDSSGFDPARRLCDDGSCVGVMGADGRCSVCGQPAKAS